MNTDTTPIENLLAIVQAVKQHGREDLAEWFSVAVEEYLVSDKPLERLLCLHSEGGRRTARTAWRLARRDTALCDAFACIQEKNTYRRILVLKEKLSDFEARIWPRYADNSEPPTGWSQLSKCLFRALNSGCTLPTGLSQFYQIVDG